MSSTEESGFLLIANAYHLLIKITQLGIEVGESQAAIQIAEALGKAFPDVPNARISQALCYASLGQLGDAIRELEAIVECFPDFQLGRAMLGFYMKLSGRSGWESYLEAVINDGREELLVRIAIRLLGRSPEESLGNVGAASGETPAPPDYGSGHVVWA